jgi:hypothetical protein
MKKRTALYAFVFLLTCSVASAQNYKMGLGVRFSNDDAVVNNSISFKYFFSENTAIESLLSLGKPLAIGLLVEKHKPVFSKGFNYFYGGGAYAAFGRSKLGESRMAGLQGVLGLDYKTPLLPLNFSIDWKPELNLANEFSFEPAAIGLTARFSFR